MEGQAFSCNINPLSNINEAAAFKCSNNSRNRNYLVSVAAVL